MPKPVWVVSAYCHIFVQYVDNGIISFRHYFISTAKTSIADWQNADNNLKNLSVGILSVDIASFSSKKWNNAESNNADKN